MATTACAVTPTLTRIDVSTSTASLTTFSESTSTIPGEITTTTFTSLVCDSTGLPDVTETPACSLTTSESLITGDPLQTVFQVPITTFSDILFTSTTTLFSVSCSSMPISPNPDTSVAPVTTPPPPVPVVTSSVTHTSNSTELPSQTNGDHASTATLQSGFTSGKKTAIGAVLGGVIGGVVLFAVLLWLCWRFLIKPSVGNSILFKSTQPDAGGPVKTKNMLDDEDDYPEKTEYGWTNQPPPSSTMLHPSTASYSPPTPTSPLGTQQPQYPTQLRHQISEDIHQQQRYPQFEWGRERVPTRAEGKQRALSDCYGGIIPPPLSPIPGTPTSRGSMFSAPSSAYSHQGLLPDSQSQSLQPAIPSEVMEQYQSRPPSVVVGAQSTSLAQPAMYKTTNSSPTGLYRRGYTDSSGSPAGSVS